MLSYKIVLKGLKPGEDDYETIEVIIEGETDIEVENKIADAIYEVRNKHQYYKMRYVSKVVYDGSEVQERDCGTEQVQK
ncbi:hypothetical protein DQT32_04210 [Salmonella enterica subsp. enterica serovar Braenderup]|nr:hypothetical protein [Salmonella enterica subsp. enterica serovar Braenderup]